MRGLLVVSALLVAVCAAAYDPTRALRGVYLSSIAGCSHSSIKAWSCARCTGHLPSITNVTVVYNDTADCQGFVGYDASSNDIVMSFRGSSNLWNWLEDFDFFFKDYPNAPDCHGCKVHTGFYDTWRQMAPTLLAAMQALATAHPSANLFVTGHSMGAAQAQLAGLDVKRTIRTNGQVLVYDFGTPRVGNPQFAAWAEGILGHGEHYHVTHDADPVPHLPPIFFGFLHFPREVWYKRGISPVGYKVCDGNATHEDPTCADSVLPLNVTDHDWYLDVKMHCDE